MKSVHHIQITVQPDQEAQARAFYGNVMQLKILPKPEVLAGRGGFWCELGAVQIHVGLEDHPREQSKVHIAYEVEDLNLWRARLEAEGISIKTSIPIPGMDRFECRDPFGNRMEFLQRHDAHREDEKVPLIF